MVLGGFWGLLTCQRLTFKFVWSLVTNACRLVSHSRSNPYTETALSSSSSLPAYRLLPGDLSSTTCVATSQY